MRLVFCFALLAVLGSCTPKSTDGIPGKITGFIRIDPKLQASLKPTDILFVIARDQPKGPPSAVRRVAHPEFPYRYTLGPEDAMIPGTPGFQAGGTLVVTARISHSGYAKPQPGDLEGVYKDNPTSPSSGGVDITLDRVREEQK